MIAHSLPGEAFGPAQGVHGATFVVDAAFYAETLGENDIVVDIGLAAEALARVLAPLNLRNLDDLDVFKGRRSTTEVLSKHIFDALSAEIVRGAVGEDTSIVRLKVTLHESHVARGSFEGPLAR